MSVLIVVPARYASTRFPAKPLVNLCGATGLDKSLIQRSWEAASAVPDADVCVATDDERIAEVSLGFGAHVVMTSEQARNGTERCAEAAANIGKSYDIIVNLQGDAPLTPPWFITDLVTGLKNAPKADIATPVLKCDAETLGNFQADRKAGRVGGTTAVFDNRGKAIYFSKEVLPYADKVGTEVFHHVGVYAYTADGLQKYMSWDEGRLEKTEGLEQLRFIENDGYIQCVEVDGQGRAFWEVNNPEDVPRVESMLAKLGIE